jgi:hypothetical protein
MRAKWEEAKRQSSCHTAGVWSGEIDEAARRGIVAVDEAIEWQRKNLCRSKTGFGSLTCAFMRLGGTG